MTIIRVLGCEMTGLSTDGKPDHPGLVDYRFYETDTGNIWYYGGAAWGLVAGPSDPANLTNKTMTSMDNDFRGVAVDHALSFNPKRTGVMMPGVSVPYLAGALGGMATTVGAGESTVSLFDTTEGNYQNFRGNLTLEKMGIQSTSSTNSLITTRAQNPNVKIRCKIDSTPGVRLWLGFTSNQTLPVSNTVLGTADSGVIIGFGSATSNFTIFYNDGLGGAMATQNFGSGIAKDQTWHTYEINMTSTSVTCALDGANQVSLGTQIPATTTPLYFNAIVQYV